MAAYCDEAPGPAPSRRWGPASWGGARAGPLRSEAMADETTTSLARSMWEASERYHQLCYVAPEVRSAGTEAGLKGFWMNYFATRVAPLGPVGPEVVESVFFYYSPRRVHRAIPDAWRFSTPEKVLAARYRAMDAALRRQLGPLADGPEVAEAVELQRRSLTQGVSVVGKSLFAGWSALPEPEPPHLALWHLTTVQREYRSGCHLLALGAAGLDGCESVVSQVAVDEAPRIWITDEAGWSDEEAAAAIGRLADRGWVNPDGTATEEGRRARAAIEATTDELDGARWRALGQEGCDRLRELMAVVNAPLPPDDQLDWREIYGDN